MRTCMYCGRELAKGEQCTCPQSVMRRNGNAKSASGAGKSEANNKQNTQNTQNARNTQYTQNQGTSYKTGYAGKDSPFERARDRYKAKRAARGARPRGGTWRDIWSAVISPVETVTNPPNLGIAAMLIIAAVMGAFLWLGAYFVLIGGGVGPFRLAAAMMGFGGGYPLIARIGLTLLSGMVAGVIMFFLYTGIFYLIGRFIIRVRTPYWQFCVRLVTAWIPFTVICIIGALLSLLSPLTLAALILCGAAITAALTYVALKTEWYSAPPSKVLLSMLLGYFLFLSIMLRLILTIN